MAPDFALPDDQGRTVRLSSLRGKPVVLVFYPGDDTPGCTKQLCEFRDTWAHLQASGVVIFGISPQSESSHRSFREKYHLPFPLLVDQGQQVAEIFQARGWWVKRTVYGIDAEGIIRFAERGMPSPAAVLAALG